MTMGCRRRTPSLRINLAHGHGVPGLSDAGQLSDYPNHWEISGTSRTSSSTSSPARRITFRTRVDRVAPTADGPGYDVTITSLADPDAAPETRRYRWVLVASGHHWNRLARAAVSRGVRRPGHAHSHDYKTPDFLLGKRVVVLGIRKLGRGHRGGRPGWRIGPIWPCGAVPTSYRATCSAGRRTRPRLMSRRDRRPAAARYRDPVPGTRAGVLVWPAAAAPASSPAGASDHVQ